jgi:hypothetical protein
MENDYTRKLFELTSIKIKPYNLNINREKQTKNLIWKHSKHLFDDRLV